MPDVEVREPLLGCLSERLEDTPRWRGLTRPYENVGKAASPFVALSRRPKQIPAASAGISSSDGVRTELPICVLPSYAIAHRTGAQIADTRMTPSVTADPVRDRGAAWKVPGARRRITTPAEVQTDPAKERRADQITGALRPRGHSITAAR